ncbi:MAG: universal stress protein [Hyphomicrobiales bacterium]
MADTYVVGFDGSEQAQRALDFAVANAKDSGASIHLVFVLEWSPYSFHTAEELAERHGRREKELERANAVIQPAADKLNDAGVKTTCEAHHGNAADILCGRAKEKGASQIIVGRTGGTSFAERILGGLTINLLQASPVPITVVP